MLRAFINKVAYIVVAIMSFNIFIEKTIVLLIRYNKNRYEDFFKRKLQYFYIKRNSKRDLLRWVSISSNKKKILVNPCSIMYTNLYFGRGIFEPLTTEFINNNLKLGDTFVDIGSNAGDFTVIPADKIGKDGKVYAFEPNNKIFERLVKTVKKNKLENIVELSNKVLSNSDATHIKLYISNDPQNDGISSIEPWEGHLESGNLSEANTLVVSSITFSNFALKQKINNPKIIKIDVEGAENFVLQGMKDFLSISQPQFLIIETYMHSKLCKNLEKLGYDYNPLEIKNNENNFGNILFTYKNKKI